MPYQYCVGLAVRHPESGLHLGEQFSLESLGPQKPIPGAVGYMGSQQNAMRGANKLPLADFSRECRRGEYTHRLSNILSPLILVVCGKDMTHDSWLKRDSHGPEGPGRVEVDVGNCLCMLFNLRIAL